MASSTSRDVLDGFRHGKGALVTALTLIVLCGTVLFLTARFTTDDTESLRRVLPPGSMGPKAAYAMWRLS